jgi:hypothetical protein
LVKQQNLISTPFTCWITVLNVHCISCIYFNHCIKTVHITTGIPELDVSVTYNTSTEAVSLCHESTLILFTSEQCFMHTVHKHLCTQDFLNVCNSCVPKEVTEGLHLVASYILWHLRMSIKNYVVRLKQKENLHIHNTGHETVNTKTATKVIQKYLFDYFHCKKSHYM